MNLHKPMFFLSLLTAVVGSIAYHFFLKKTQANIHPVVSIMWIYLFALLLCFFYLLLFVPSGDWGGQFTQVGWAQFGTSVAVILIELGFLMMYRYGWDLSVGNVTVGATANIVLLLIGGIFLREHLSAVNVLGVACCALGVGLVLLK